MTKRVTITCVVAIAVLQAAAPARATIGSIISSFGLTGWQTYGIYCGGNYVYISENWNNTNYLRTYTRTGTYLRRVRLLGADPYPILSGSRTHLGAGYVALIDYSAQELEIYSINRGGSPVTSFRIMNNPHNNFWNGDYYYISRRTDKERVSRYTPSGSYAGYWTCAGWPGAMRYCSGAAYAQHGNKSEGPYFVASSGESGRPCCMTTFPGGSLVSTWIVPTMSIWHLSYGDSSNPGTYGAAIWAIHTSPTTHAVLEIDIDARGASSVVPASLGKVKAIYR
jgi:hypothetical protein